MYIDVHWMSTTCIKLDKSFGVKADATNSFPSESRSFTAFQSLQPGFDASDDLISFSRELDWFYHVLSKEGLVCGHLGIPSTMCLLWCWFSRSCNANTWLDAIAAPLQQEFIKTCFCKWTTALQRSMDFYKATFMVRLTLILERPALGSGLDTLSATCTQNGALAFSQLLYILWGYIGIYYIIYDDHIIWIIYHIPQTNDFLWF